VLESTAATFHTCSMNLASGLRSNEPPSAPAAALSSKTQAQSPQIERGARRHPHDLIQQRSCAAADQEVEHQRRAERGSESHHEDDEFSGHY
jgi:hypothetical protein